ncbi:histone-lysine N-methyltransferase SMYD3 isoform X1 [Chiloscyllium plagiosum]|uniref:histone-lysine N-methyltransferase SMYD3 isoform X1 n=3 Tax=Chiloscyllium plagiosum TaxID=36176 RepID=UPI001CB7C06D|nr:histone-lysine N-methyltransferase SMYD3 isoform X1 [Chiloscyllium plagiosum]
MARYFQRNCCGHRGEGLKANRAIVPGQLLYSASPYTYIPSKKAMGSVCEHCLSREGSLLRCSQCKMARYCSTVCQKLAWLDHKRECKCLRSIYPKVPTDMTRLVARIIFKLLTGLPCPSEELYSVSDLQSNIKEMSEEMKGGLGQLTAMLQFYIKEEIPSVSQLPPGLSLLHLFGQVTCNCFTISDGEMQEIGVGLYPSMSLLNHSCDPNCVIVFDRKQLQLHAIRQIQADEELTISYIDVMATSPERRRQLETQYCFTCDCVRCETADKDSDMLAGEKHAWKEIKESIPKVEKLQSAGNWEEVVEVCQAFIDKNRDVLPDTNLYLLKMLDAAMDGCIHLARWEDALCYSVRTLRPYQLYYAGAHPVRGVQLMRVGKLQHHQGKLKEAAGTLKQAFDILKVTHGREHPLTDNLQQVLAECEAEFSFRPQQL